MNDTTLCYDTTYNVIQSLCIIYKTFNAQVKFRQLPRLLVSLWTLMHSVTITTLLSEETINKHPPDLNTQQNKYTKYLNFQGY